ncbi:MAG: hypothetical protein JXM70_04955 [Pirellulales bacterium]|nr:hypothetical protein [Pirellulales bacterium]
MKRVMCRRSIIIGSVVAMVFAACSMAHAELAGVEPLRAAIEDLTNTFGDHYSSGQKYIAHLDQIVSRAKAKPSAANAKSLQSELEQLRREALIANPLVSSQPLLFVVRRQYRTDHHCTATLFQTGEVNTHGFDGGGSMKTIDFSKDIEGKVTTLVDLPEGIARDPDVSFDGKKVLFSMRHDIDDDYHIYKMNVDGTELKQLTFGTGLSDVDPIYLPNGRICFGSTRDLKYCQCFRNAMINLYVMEADGANIRQIGRNALPEAHPALMPDGRILYDRWEYVDRHYGPSFGLWTMYPDGTQQALYYGNNAWSPGAINDARILPGTQKFIGVFGACHDRPWGAMVIVDRRRGLDGTEPVVHSWPADISRFMSDQKKFRAGNDVYNPKLPQMSPASHPSVAQIDLFKSLKTKYEDPYPLSEKYILCSRTTGKDEQTALFLVDTFGNEIMLHQEGSGCYDPMPIEAREQPMPLPQRVDLAEKTGRFYVADIYKGGWMEQVPRGTIKTIRVVEAPPKRFWTVQAWGYDSQVSPAMNFNSTINKRIIGDAPVEDDGSAYFEVPADKFLFFQALDADGRMVQSMRSGTTIQPGETVGCVGCHDDRHGSLPAKLTHMPMAMRRPADKLIDWYGPPREFNYLTEVQPVFDKHCVSCHDYGKEAGKVLNLAGDLGLLFNTSYLDIRRRSSLRWFPEPLDAPKRMVKVVDDGPPEVLSPYAWGSTRSKLAEVIRKEHYDVKLDREDIDRITTWIDINAPYYGTYASAYRDNHFGRSPLDPGQLARLVQLTGVPLNSGRMGAEMRGSQVNFTRPELSPCLARFKDKNDPNYEAALDIIRAGKAQLAKRPRADMPDFKPVCPPDLIRLAKHEFQTKIETEMRQAIALGKRRYEKDDRRKQAEILKPKRPDGVMPYVDLTGSMGTATLDGGRLLIDHKSGGGGAKTVGLDRNFSELAGKKYSLSCRFEFNATSHSHSWCALRLDNRNTNEVVGGDLEFLARRTGWWRVYSHGKEIAGDDVSLPAAMQYDVQLVVNETASPKTYSAIVNGKTLVDSAAFTPGTSKNRYVALKHYGYGPTDGYRFDNLMISPLPLPTKPQAKIGHQGGYRDSFDTKNGSGNINDELGPPRQSGARPLEMAGTGATGLGSPLRELSPTGPIGR